MTEEKTSGSIGNIIKPITDITVSVGAVVAYIQGIFKIAETPIPNTVSLLLIVASSMIVISRRWGKLNQKKKKTQNSRNSKTPRRGSFLERLLAPIRPSKSDPYVQSLPRRRMEAGFIAGLTVFTLGWSGVNAKSVLTELTTDPALTCSYAEGEDNLLVIVADVLETGGQQWLVSSKIYNELVNNQEGNLYDVCHLEEAFDVTTKALNKATERNADIMIWGIKDAAGYEMHLETPAFEDHDKTISEATSEELASSDFLVHEPKQIAYLTEFALGEILLLNGQTRQAQTRLRDAISRAERDGLGETNPTALARGYFLQGFLYDSMNLSDSDRETVLNAYETAFELDHTLYGARFNRGLVYLYSGQVDEAMDEFTYVIENDDRLKAGALINRASLQVDPEARRRDLDEAIKLDPADGYFFSGIDRYQQEDYKGAIEDFKKAIEADPGEFYYYHLLGQAQLYAGEADAAKRTYERIIPRLDEDRREQVIAELREDAEFKPEIAPAVEEIIRALQKARLP